VRPRRAPLIAAHWEFNNMKLQETLIRLKRFQVEEKRRRVAQIESMVAEFSKIARELEQEVAIEEQRAGIFDTAHFAYPTYARAARTRRDNLNRSAAELMTQLEDARGRLEEALDDLSKAQGFDARDPAAEGAGELALASQAKSGLRLRAAQI
jgi:flagellar export protein FliJ